jgi:carbonic anhydrase/acetyltransferase-like protein (isoleucine patch superfamily)
MIRSYKGVRPTIPATCFVDESAQIIGDVVLGEHASVWMNAVVRGDVHEIRIGAYSNVQDNSSNGASTSASTLQSVIR